MKDEIIIEKKALRDGLVRKFVLEASPGAFEVFQVIGAYSEDDKSAEVTVETLCAKTGYSLGKMCRIISRLEQAGFITRMRKGQGGLPQRYELRGVK